MCWSGRKVGRLDRSVRYVRWVGRSVRLAGISRSDG